jgi:hypothetical protein
MSLNNVVKFFIFLIVIVFDPLAIALVIAFNQLVLGENKKEEEEEIKEDKTKDIIEEESRLKLSENDLKILESALLNPLPPNEKLKEAAQRYSDEVREKHTHIEDFKETPVKPQLTQEERGEILAEMMKNDQELGLYDEPFDNPLVKEETSDWDVTLMDGLEDEEPFFTEEEIENILQEEPTEEEIQGNFSTIEPETENIFQDNEFITPVDEPELSFSDEFITEAIQEFNQESIQEEINDSVPETITLPFEPIPLPIELIVEEIIPDTENIIEQPTLGQTEDLTDEKKN